MYDFRLLKGDVEGEEARHRLFSVTSPSATEPRPPSELEQLQRIEGKEVLNQPRSVIL